MPIEKASSSEKSYGWRQGHVFSFWVIAAVVIAAGLHIQPTLTFAGAEIRVSLADLALPILAPFTFLVLLRNRTLLQSKVVYVGLALLAAASVVMTYGLAIGVEQVGGIESWAAVKYLGWFVLLAYAALGLAMAMTGDEKPVHAFIATFTAIHVVLLIVYILITSAGTNWSFAFGRRMYGLVANPNAYGLALLCGISLVLSLGNFFQSWLPRFWWEALTGLLCAGVLFSRSLGALAGFVAVFIVFLVLRGQPAALLRIIVCTAMIYLTPTASVALLKSLEFKVSTGILYGDDRGIEQKISNPENYGFSISRRLDSNSRAIQTWREAPWFGAGLGVFIANERQRVSGDAPALQVHNTALWLLAEFGLAGLAVFSVLFITVFAFLVRAMNRYSPRDPPVADLMLSGVLILSAWGVMSLAHELMYQRVPWFVLGLCAGVAILAEKRKTGLT